MDNNAECSVSKTLQQIQKALAQNKDLLAKMQFMGCKSKKNCAAEHHFKAWHSCNQKSQKKKHFDFGHHFELHKNISNNSYLVGELNSNTISNFKLFTTL